MSKQGSTPIIRDTIKRLFDIISNSSTLLVLSPLLLLLAVWIKLDSKGDIFFTQKRIGKDLKPFRVVKFRTMFQRDPDSIDQMKEGLISGGEDARVTPAGRFLRRTSLDELPQLWNILLGDMSVVGPRPIIPEQLDAIRPEYMDRFKVRPGLTGLSQVRGRRDLDWILWLEADREYAANYGFLYDLGLILRTVVVVFTGRGLYSTGEGRNWRDILEEIRAEKSGRS